MINIKGDLGLEATELAEAIEAKVTTALAVAISEAEQEGRRLAASRLKAGFGHWNKGFKAHKIDENLYMFTIEGKLADWMEDGIQVGEISKAIMGGNRAHHNAREGKEYVDVPIAKDADAIGNIGNTGINVRKFTNADELKDYLFSDYKRKAIVQKRRLVQRVEQVIKSTNPETNSTQYLTIHRVTKDSIWPKTPFSGVKILEDLGLYIEENFDKILQRFI